MLVLYDSCIRNISVCIVYHSISLIILLVENLCLKSYRTVLERAILESKELIDHTCVHSLVCNIRILLDELKVICISLYISAFQHLLDDLCVSTHRDSLETIIEIVVVVYESQRQSLDYKCRKFCTRSSPLFLCISLYKLLIYICTCKL